MPNEKVEKALKLVEEARRINNDLNSLEREITSIKKEIEFIKRATEYKITVTEYENVDVEIDDPYGDNLDMWGPRTKTERRPVSHTYTMPKEILINGLINKISVIEKEMEVLKEEYLALG